MRTDLARLDSDHPMLTDDGTRLRDAADRLLTVQRPRLDRLWAYYRNPMRLDVVADASGAQRPYRQAQEWGLPSRVTGVVAGENVFDGTVVPGVARKEVVIENDIGWRVETQIDFLVGHPIVVNSASPDPARRPAIETLLRQVLANNGGLVFLQRLALLGAVYGGVDVLVKFTPDAAGDVPADACATQLLGALTDPPSSDLAVPSVPGPPHAGPALAAEASPADASGDDVASGPGASTPSPETIDRLARMIRFEIVDPTRALPLLEPTDCRCVHAFANVYRLERTKPAPTQRPNKWWQSPFSRFTPAADPDRVTVIDLVTAAFWQTYEDDVLVSSGPNTLGRLPLVHVQNTADPMSYDGASDVEALIPLQDELNTRLSDRAYRIAMQSFKMYLGIGIENFSDLPVTPGRMWSTDNEKANVIEFGGDSACPSEESHIAEVREAMDKLSGVSRIASGAIRGKIGNLTSAEALRVTMMALLSRTERKRTTYGTAITQMCELALAWLDHAGLLATTASDRAIQIHWPNPMPSNEDQQLALARAKEQIGIPRDVVLRELGYGPPQTPPESGVSE